MDYTAHFKENDEDKLCKCDISKSNMDKVLHSHVTGKKHKKSFIGVLSFYKTCGDVF